MQAWFYSAISVLALFVRGCVLGMWNVLNSSAMQVQCAVRNAGSGSGGMLPVPSPRPRPGSFTQQWAGFALSAP